MMRTLNALPTLRRRIPRDLGPGLGGLRWQVLWRWAASGPIRRFQSNGLVRARLAKFTSGGEERPLDAIPIVQSSSGGLPSGALLLALTTSMSFGIIALFDYPSQVSNLHPWIDVVPLVWFLVGPFLIGLLSESRGVGAITILGLRLGIASVALHSRREYKYTLLRHWLAWVPALAGGHTWADAVSVIPIRKSAQVTILLSRAY